MNKKLLTTVEAEVDAAEHVLRMAKMDLGVFPDEPINELFRELIDGCVNLAEMLRSAAKRRN